MNPPTTEPGAADPLERLDWPLRTARLTLRRARAEDGTATWRYRRLPEVAEWLPSAPTDEHAHVRRFVEPDRLRRTLVAECAGAVVADLKLDVVDGWGQDEVAHLVRGVEAEVGWALDPAHGGRGFATEAVAELLRVCFEELGLRRVVAHCFADNVASRRLMERLGMRRETHALRDSLHRSGRWLDAMSYALLEEEYAQRR